MLGLALVRQLKRQIGKDKVQVILCSGYVLYVLHVQDLSESVLICLGFCFLLFCVKVTAEGEVGYGTIMVAITDG